ncbi:NADPH-dependent FMN reductase [Streptomyces durmitorensis]|uniref:NAD(P)H-dependent oxidoreductase n=1 Tax=Streptomyces durmitorensis TaxID=319947 RepID=A0ABY4Q317_9ACTN|nr:NAD(P)H-dependent oxidoreductase [Streptomyces durmitorensis]UQT60029.1 NAD(P)H-dependent oxidoreductase [Streptomyces durmitorensis]
MATHRLHIVSASTRPTSAGRPLAHWLTERARVHGEFAPTLIDLGEVALPFLDEPEHPSEGRYLHQHTKNWSATVGAADSFVFVMPMYNGGFSAPLKNAIDFLHQEWQGKPVGLISYSAGTSGGAPAVEMLRPVLDRVGLRPAPRTLSIPGIEGHLTPDRRFRATPALTGDADAVLDAVATLLTPQRPRAGATRS